MQLRRLAPAAAAIAVCAAGAFVVTGGLSSAAAPVPEGSVYADITTCHLCDVGVRPARN